MPWSSDSSHLSPICRNNHHLHGSIRHMVVIPFFLVSDSWVIVPIRCDNPQAVAL
jgi:hypothetical protein